MKKGTKIIREYNQLGLLFIETNKGLFNIDKQGSTLCLYNSNGNCIETKEFDSSIGSSVNEQYSNLIKSI